MILYDFLPRYKFEYFSNHFLILQLILRVIFHLLISCMVFFISYSPLLFLYNLVNEDVSVKILCTILCYQFSHLLIILLDESYQFWIWESPCLLSLWPIRKFSTIGFNSCGVLMSYFFYQKLEDTLSVSYITIAHLTNFTPFTVLSEFIFVIFFLSAFLYSFSYFHIYNFLVFLFFLLY